MYYGYNGMTKNKTGGQALIERAANQGRHNAQYHLGVIYMEQGKYKEAGEWLLKSCDSDNTGVRADARYQLAFLLKDGKGFAQDMTLACHNLLTSAKEGSKKAAAVINQPDNGFFDSGDQVFLDALAEVGYDMEQMLENILENSQG
jgi:TPR repeat protein